MIPNQNTNSSIAESNKRKKPIFSLRISLILSGIIFVFLILHSIKHDLTSSFQFDIYSIYLLGLFIVVIFLSRINGLYYNGYTISSEEVNEVESQYYSIKDEPKIKEIKEDVQKNLKEKEISELVKHDPQYAFALTRMNIDTNIKTLYKVSNPEKDHKYLYRKPIKQILSNLSRDKVISQEYYQNIQNIYDICSRAIHGEAIDQYDADKIIMLGQDIIDYLKHKTLEQTTNNTIKQDITSEQLDDFFNASYTVKTVIPYVENPQMNIRILNQEELNELLDNYSEYAEFLVEISKNN